MAFVACAAELRWQKPGSVKIKYTMSCYRRPLPPLTTVVSINSTSNRSMIRMKPGRVSILFTMKATASSTHLGRFCNERHLQNLRRLRA